ncbi:MAG: ABC transporter ATP-binding protein [Pseudomonadota bacterium]
MIRPCLHTDGPRKSSPTPLLHVEDLHVRFASDTGPVAAVNGISLRLEPGETLVVLGESGSGKSVMAQALMGVVPSPPGVVTIRKLRLNGTDLLRQSPTAHRRLRGREMALIFQDALTSLNPRFTIGTQLCEMLRVHLGLSRRAARDRAVQLLALVGIPSPRVRLDAYPHQFSGGMRQRALIAMAVALNPKLLIADEPTTALDVTVQAQILDLIKRLQKQAGMGLILITHDLSVARQIADRVAVMYAGRIVETARTRDLFERPGHPYTEGLMRSTPRAAALGSPLAPIAGSPPDLRKLPHGCAFHPRCPRAIGICRAEPPPMRVISRAHSSLCHLAEEVE